MVEVGIADATRWTLARRKPRLYGSRILSSAPATSSYHG